MPTEKENTLLEYHRKSLRDGTFRTNEDGSVTTVRVIGVPAGGKIYNVPGFDPETGKDLDEMQALEKFGSVLESFPSYQEAFDGPIEEHPSNVAARKLHKVIDLDRIPTQ